MKPKPAHYLKEWREHRGLRQTDMVGATQKSAPTLSKVETCRLPYTEGILKGYAELCRCNIVDLLYHSPKDPGVGLFEEWGKIRNRQFALALLQAFAANEPTPEDPESDEGLQ